MEKENRISEDDIRNHIMDIIESTVGICTSNRPPYSELTHVRECAERIVDSCSKEIFDYLTQEAEDRKRWKNQPPVMSGDSDNKPHWWPQNG